MHRAISEWPCRAPMLLFSAEYLGRLWAAPCDPQYTCDGPRLHFVCSFFGLIDLCAILPFWIDVFSTRIVHGRAAIDTSFQTIF
jgi:hypothetical protein